MAKCIKCGGEEHTQEAEGFYAAEHTIDYGEFSSGPEWCECEEIAFHDMYPNGAPPEAYDIDDFDVVNLISDQGESLFVKEKL